MNQTQVKYVRQRADSIFSKRKSDIRDKYTTPAKLLSTESKLNALSVGDFTLKQVVDDVYYGRRSWYEYVNFNGESIAFVDQESISNETEALKVQYENLLDALILGDNNEALELLKAFEAA